MPEKSCPYCKLSIPTEASICGHCGKGVSGLHLAGTALSSIGCILTMFVTIPLILLAWFCMR